MSALQVPAPHEALLFGLVPASPAAAPLAAGAAVAATGGVGAVLAPGFASAGVDEPDGADAGSGLAALVSALLQPAAAPAARRARAAANVSAVSEGLRMAPS